MGVGAPAGTVSVFPKSRDVKGRVTVSLLKVDAKAGERLAGS